MKSFNVIFIKAVSWLLLHSFSIGRMTGCHQMPERSFYFNDIQFPVCARCTGVIIGQSIALLLFIAGIRINFISAIVLMAVMFFDWFVQRFEKKSSSNFRRLITGTFGGYGYMTVLCKSIVLLIELFV